MFEFEHLDIEDAVEDYPDLWETAMAALPSLPPAQLAIVVSLAADTCQSCHSRDGGCQCWNDE